jgi:hypothetical protein
MMTRFKSDSGSGALALSVFAFIQGKELAEDSAGFGISQMDLTQIPGSRPHTKPLEMLVAGRNLKTLPFRLMVPSDRRWVRPVSVVKAILSSALDGQGRPTSRSACSAVFPNAF